MENRFERLYGYAQRSLVKNIRKELGNDECLTMAILLFHSFSERFYYESTVKNTLLFPNQIKKQFTEKEIWNYELMFYLAKYMSLSKTKTYIRDLISDNDTLAKKDASYFAIAFEEYDQFKKTWLEWMDNKLVFTSDMTYSDSQKSTLNSLFYFANYLLTIIGYTAYTTYFDPEDGPYKERIYRVIIDDIKDNNTGKVNKLTGELMPGIDYKWNRKLDSQINYSELSLVLEICFKQPFSVEEKIADLRSILNGTEENSKKDIEFCSMAKPLLYNGEFQGIIYVNKNLEKGVFSDTDFNKFTDAIYDFHIQSIIYSSKFDTTRILLENISELDIHVHPLIKILNSQHLFSSSPLGMIFIPQTGCFIRYRDDEFMQTKKIDLSEYRMFNFLNFILEEDYLQIAKKNHHYWIDINLSITKRFDKQLNSLLGIAEDLFIKSFILMKFIENNIECYYFLFNSNHISTASESVKQSYALRTHYDISKLIDTVISAKRMFDIQHNLMNQFQLEFFHDEKNFISGQKQRLSLAKNETTKRKVDKALDGIISDFDIKENRYTDFVKLLREQFDVKQKSVIDKNTIENIFNKMQEYINDPKIKLVATFAIGDKDTIETYGASLQFVIKELFINAFKQYSRYSAKEIKIKRIELKVEKIFDSEKQIEGFGFCIHNTGTEIPESIIEMAGEETINNGSNGSSGLGFIIVKSQLRRMNASRFGNKYFQIMNEKGGVSFRFSLPNKIIK